METATFGAGCFWGVEAEYRKLDGVLETAVGYSGGTKKKPTYQDVCSDLTGHAEVVQVKFDPEKVSYEDLVKKFWEIHNPTTLNRQGPDIGTQYRSVIFVHNDNQKRIARESLEKMNNSGKYTRHIVTEISDAKEFYRAEEYHQQYFEKKGLTACKI